MPGVFISYRRVEPDQGRALALARALRQKGVEAFIDQYIPLGASWSETIDSQLKKCDFFLPLLSAAANDSPNVREEIRIACNRHRAGDLKRILPIWLEAPSELHYSIRAYLTEIQYREWGSGPSPDVVLHEVLVVLGVQAGSALPEPTVPTAPRVEPIARIRRPQGGTEPIESPFYQPRREDHEIVEPLQDERGCTLILRGPRQSGKSSLLERVRKASEDLGYQFGFVDFEDSFSDDELADLRTFLFALGALLADEFQTEIKLSEMWDDDLPPKRNMSKFLENAVLRGAESQVVICLDETDRLFRREFAQEFFGMVRGWHERRNRGRGWERLNIVIAHATDPSLWIRDLHQSPFNVGQHEFLLGFTLDEVRAMNRVHGEPIATAGELHDLLELTGGQPFLVRYGLYLVSEGHSVREIRDLPLDGRHPFRPHLLGLDRIVVEESVQRPLRMVLRHGNVESDRDFQSLLAAGIIKGESRNGVQMRCELYERYFRQVL